MYLVYIKIPCYSRPAYSKHFKFEHNMPTNEWDITFYTFLIRIQGETIFYFSATAQHNVMIKTNKVFDS